VVKDGESGLLFSHGDEAALAQALRRLSDDAVVSGLGQGAFAAFWQAPPTLERHVSELLTVYNRLLA
jgi:glycosyltransferase involved in cell wall biosynthesis